MANPVRRAAKVDRNHADIVKALRQMGASVETLAREGRGVPDLLVGYRGINLLLEIKAEKGTLRPLQTRWRDDWRGGRPIVVRSIDDALEALGAR